MGEPRKNDGRRVESAPGACGPGASAGVVSVVVGEDEEVRWCWTHFPDGRSVVTGYEIVEKAPDEQEPEAGAAGFNFERAVSDLLWPQGRGKSAPPAADAPPRRTRRRIGF